MRAVLIIAALLAFAVPANAHVNGVSYEKEKDGYIIDAGYGAPAPSVDESLLLDFRLRKDGKDAVFSDVWIKITYETGAVVFASGIHNAEFGGPRMSYVFPKAGKYEVSMRFENGSESIVEDSFPITVLPSNEGSIVLWGIDITPYLYLLAGLIVGILLMIVPGLVLRRKELSSS